MSRSVLNNGGLWSQRCSSWVFFGFQSIAQFDLVASLLQCHCGIVNTNVNAPDQKTALRALRKGVVWYEFLFQPTLYNIEYSSQLMGRRGQNL